jgi:putative hydrolases of HD superfamily
VSERLEAILRFLETADRLKQVERRGLTPDGQGGFRRENSAEHVWHVALAAMLLHPDSAARPDLLRVLEMILIHDLVEIEAGDTYAYDAAGRATQEAREDAAAALLFAQLPPDLAARFHALRAEFEAGTSAEARFAQGCDRLQGFFQNAISGGRSWRENGVTLADTRVRMAPARAADPAIAAAVDRVEARALAEGTLPLTPANAAP